MSKIKCQQTFTLVFSREFKDWHLQWGNGFHRLLGNGCSHLDDFFGRPPLNFDSIKMGKNSAALILQILHYAYSQSFFLSELQELEVRICAAKLPHYSSDPFKRDS